MEEKLIATKESINKKVLILSCGTGGGHNSAAKAIQENLLEKGIKADFIEYLDIINPKLRDKINNLYLKTTVKEGQVFKKVYRLGELYEKTKLKSPVYKLNSLSKNKLFEYLTDKKYDYIVTTHLFPAQALTALKKERDIHFIEVATDYVCIPFWEETNPDYFIIPHEELVNDFLSKGIKREKLLPFGIPVAKCYCKEYNKEECKKELSLQIDQKYILILNGSMGFGNVLKLVRELLKKLKDVNLIVSCGNNTKLLKNLRNTYEQENRVISLPYTNNLNRYMVSSEIVLSKPGGLTTTEIATIRKPFIHTIPIPGCENYNADFFETRKMSMKCSTIQEIVEKTEQLLFDQKMKEEMLENQMKYIDVDACEKISDFIIQELKLR